MADLLNKDGSRRRNGKPWTPRQIEAILSRRVLYEQSIIHYGNISGENKNLILLDGLK
ncbi:MAG TPA: hypothetical protein EYG58_00020 [Nitrospirales bacterium]|nr:hypothetical protein [Nitrospirales bacterium]HIO68924.1 hypothetical protein [Nitrospirales bacterium]